MQQCTTDFRFYCSVQKWHTAERGIVLLSHCVVKVSYKLNSLHIYSTSLLLLNRLLRSFVHKITLVGHQKIADLSPNYTQHSPSNSPLESNTNGARNRTLSAFGPAFFLWEVCWNIWHYMDDDRHEKIFLFAVHLNRQDLSDLWRFIMKPLPFSHSTITTDRNVSHHQ
jgi:hypothetical protein